MLICGNDISLKKKYVAAGQKVLKRTVRSSLNKRMGRFYRKHVFEVSLNGRTSSCIHLVLAFYNDDKWDAR